MQLMLNHYLTQSNLNKLSKSQFAISSFNNDNDNDNDNSWKLEVLESIKQPWYQASLQVPTTLKQTVANLLRCTPDATMVSFFLNALNLGYIVETPLATPAPLQSKTKSKAKTKANPEIKRYTFTFPSQIASTIYKDSSFHHMSVPDYISHLQPQSPFPPPTHLIIVSNSSNSSRPYTMVISPVTGLQTRLYESIKDSCYMTLDLPIDTYNRLIQITSYYHLVRPKSSNTIRSQTGLASLAIEAMVMNLI